MNPRIVLYSIFLALSDGDGEEEPKIDFSTEAVPVTDDLIRLQVWLSPHEEFNWLSSELFLKQLYGISHRIGFEIVGNKEQIQIRFLTHKRDIPVVRTSFQGQFNRCELSAMSEDPLRQAFENVGHQVTFLDFFPLPPYSHLLTRPEELQISPYQSLIAGLMEITPPVMGFYQTLFQPVHPEHNWHQNVQILQDLEFASRQINSAHLPQRYSQQAPSGDLRQMSQDLETKAHNDKPFFCMASRLGVVFIKEDASLYLNALSAFVNLFQHGGRPLGYISDVHYKHILSHDSTREMFLSGVTYRPGFLVNSAELTGPVHIPPAGILESRRPPIKILETLPVQDPSTHEGTPLGSYNYGGVEYPVCIPLDQDSYSTHLISRPGMGKSTLMAQMNLKDIERGIGVAVMDPHGDLIDDLLRLIKEKDIEKVIYFDLSLPDYVPIWNPLKRTKGQDVSRTADDLIAVMKTVFHAGWGDRMEHLFRHGLYALLQIPDSTFQDLSTLLNKRTKHNAHLIDPLRRSITATLKNQEAIDFWESHIDDYSKEAFDPPRHRLSKLLVSGNISLMLSQPENLIDFRKIMDEGMILLVKLTKIGKAACEILGCLMLSLLHLTALGRSDTPLEMRKPFHIYVDEAHRFVTDALEDLIAETRKFGVSLTLAHQYLNQFDSKKVDALSSVGTTVIMNVDGKDARHLTKDLRESFKYED